MYNIKLYIKANYELQLATVYQSWFINYNKGTTLMSDVTNGGAYGAGSGSFHGNRWGNNGNSDRLYFWGAPKSLQMATAAMKLKDTCSLEEKL